MERATKPGTAGSRPAATGAPARDSTLIGADLRVGRGPAPAVERRRGGPSGRPIGGAAGGVFAWGPEAGPDGRDREDDRLRTVPEAEWRRADAAGDAGAAREARSRALRDGGGAGRPGAYRAAADAYSEACAPAGPRRSLREIEL